MTGVHRGPAKGYNSREKQAYRKSVWAAMKSAIEVANDSSDSRPYYILMLPGLSTKEIDVAIKQGLREDRIFLVHESKEHVENEAEWRVKYPNIAYRTGLLSDVLESCKNSKICFAGANLDFCGNFSSETVDQYSAFCDYCNQNQSSQVPLTVGVTITKGRETPSMVRMLEKLHTRNSPIGLNEKRLEVLVREFGVEQKSEQVMYFRDRDTKTTVNVLTEGAYIHNKAPMAYCVVEYLHPGAFVNRLLKECGKESEKVYKQFKKVAPKKLPNYFKIETKDEFISFIEKRNELLKVAEALLSPDSRVGGIDSLSKFYCLSGGSRTKVKTLSKRFLRKSDLEHFETTLRSYHISSCTSLDFSISSWKDRQPAVPSKLTHMKKELEEFILNA